MEVRRHRVTGERACLVGGGGAGGDADDHGAGGQPVLGLDELAVRHLVQDGVVHGEAVGRVDPERRDLVLLADLLQAGASTRSDFRST